MTSSGPDSRNSREIGHFCSASITQAPLRRTKTTELTDKTKLVRDPVAGLRGLLVSAEEGLEARLFREQGDRRMRGKQSRKKKHMKTTSQKKSNRLPQESKQSQQPAPAASPPDPKETPPPPPPANPADESTALCSSLAPTGRESRGEGPRHRWNFRYRTTHCQYASSVRWLKCLNRITS